MTQSHRALFERYGSPILFYSPLDSKVENDSFLKVKKTEIGQTLLKGFCFVLLFATQLFLCHKTTHLNKIKN